MMYVNRRQEVEDHQKAKTDFIIMYFIINIIIILLMFCLNVEKSPMLNK